ncbi:small ribosomal subunit protein uS10m-like isoform X2 [Acipenser ruthenus]|uniref:small ribosomal subunit protein uS10m-like isoform X2 n=1 Tax=Acipenser ruthenus TaxID=7906 RepID=UPI00145BA055|nr:small ribosomal subunit protein uS10m-like isoform X2 [Acipenser ruthenus]XP_058881541.1 small ribosomal subunit protein uS10m-like isoform X2 [Acipenser ruthenus]
MCQDSRRKLLVTDHVNRKENPSTQAESVIMCAAVCISKDLSVLFRRLVLSRQVLRIPSLDFSRSSVISRFFCNSRLSPWVQTAGIHVGSHHCTVAPSITETEEPDSLYKNVAVLVKGHDKAVLDSYQYFATLAAQELGINIDKVYEPPKKIERLTLLKSVHIFKKHRVQYEMRTYYRRIELKHLTGCTADVYLEYIQRNLPEGVAMEVTKTLLEKLPEHIKEPVWNTISQEEEKQRQ